MIKILIAIFIGAILIFINAIFTVALIMGVFYIKKIISKMDEEKWNEYLKSLSSKQYLNRLFAIYFISTGIISYLGFIIFKLLPFKNPAIIALVIFFICIIKFLNKWHNNKDELISKIEKIHNL